MSGMCCYGGVASTPNFKRIYTARCCSNQPSDDNSKNQTPQLLKFAVSGVTELLRMFSSANNRDNNRMITKETEEYSATGVDDIVGILKFDYDNAYFVTGVFSSSIYTDDCLFEDPTIKFRGTELYSRNLKLLVPFFQQPSIVLKNIQKGANSDGDFVLASWSLRFSDMQRVGIYLRLKLLDRYSLLVLEDRQIE